MSPTSHSKPSTANDHLISYVSVPEVQVPSENSTAKQDHITFVQPSTTDGETVTYTDQALREAELKAEISKLLER